MPNGMIGTPMRRADAHDLSARPRVDCGNTTASGGWFAIQVVVLPCCSRTACEVTRRLAERAREGAQCSGDIGPFAVGHGDFSGHGATPGSSKGATCRPATARSSLALALRKAPGMRLRVEPRSRAAPARPPASPLTPKMARIAALQACCKACARKRRARSPIAVEIDWFSLNALDRGKHDTPPFILMSLHASILRKRLCGAA